MALRWRSPTYSCWVPWDTQCLDAEHIAETGDENGISIGIHLSDGIAAVNLIF